MNSDINRIRNNYTPQLLLNILVRTDRPKSQNEEWLANRLKKYWPGNYSVVWIKERHKYMLQFEDPQEELMFKLRWG